MSRAESAHIDAVHVDDSTCLRVNIVLDELVDLVLVVRECEVRSPCKVAPLVVVAYCQLYTVVRYATGLYIHLAIA